MDIQPASFFQAKAAYLAHARMHYAYNTLRSAQQALALIPEFAVMAELDEALLEIVLSRANAPATYNRYRSALVSFFDFCVARGYAGRNPARALPTRKVAEQGHLMLTPPQMLEMLEGANPVERIALALGMNTALRGSDIMALKIKDVSLTTLTLRTMIQKTGGYDEKPITAQLANELKLWFAFYFKNGGPGNPDEWFLVPSYVVGPRLEPVGMLGDITVESPRLGVTTLRPTSPLTHPHRIVQRAIERVLPGTPTLGEGFHTLRRSAARALFEKLRAEASYDHALMVVKEFLNHKSTEQTQRYLGINHERAIRDEMLRGKDFLV